MKCLVLTASPNKDGLTADCARAAAESATRAGAVVETIRLNDSKIGLCHACEQGWGTCRAEHRCQVEDGFQSVHAAACAADSYVVLTPVYFGEMAEVAKAFFDRLRRCEATRGEQSKLAGKPVIAVAAAGGSGGGTATCLDEMNRLFAHLRAAPFDLIAVTQKSRSYKVPAIGSAARAMVESLSK